MAPLSIEAAVASISTAPSASSAGGYDAATVNTPPGTPSFNDHLEQAVQQSPPTSTPVASDRSPASKATVSKVANDRPVAQDEDREPLAAFLRQPRAHHASRDERDASGHRKADDQEPQGRGVEHADFTRHVCRRPQEHIEERGGNAEHIGSTRHCSVQLRWSTNGFVYRAASALASCSTKVFSRASKSSSALREIASCSSRSPTGPKFMPASYFVMRTRGRSRTEPRIVPTTTVAIPARSNPSATRRTV